MDRNLHEASRALSVKHLLVWLMLRWGRSLLMHVLGRVHDTASLSEQGRSRSACLVVLAGEGPAQLFRRSFPNVEPESSRFSLQCTDPISVIEVLVVAWSTSSELKCMEESGSVDQGPASWRFSSFRCLGSGEVSFIEFPLPRGCRRQSVCHGTQGNGLRFPLP